MPPLQMSARSPSSLGVQGVARRCAFTLIELIVVMSIIALVISLLLPALSSSRSEGTKVKCLVNLKQIGQCLSMYSDEDEQHYTTPVHPMAETRWLYDGEYEYGGNTGVGVFRSADFVKENRLLNKYVFVDGASAELALFKCPNDRPIEDVGSGGVNFEPYFLHPSRSHLNVYQITGTSYRLNNHIDFTGTQEIPFQQNFFGPYLRTSTKVPDPGMTVLIEETVSEVAKWNPNRDVLGWHRKSNVFNVAFADGHAGPIRLSGQTGGTDPTGNYWLRRGEGWRMDCYPSAPVFDRPRRAP